MSRRILGLLAVSATMAFWAGCGRDGGKKVLTPVEPGPTVTIDRLTPARTVVADTVNVIGSNFGATQGTSMVTFSGGGDARIGATVLSWSDAEVKVLVPDGTADGPVLVVLAGSTSNGASFSRAARLISFTNDLMPLFDSKGCASCHGGTNNLFLDTAKNLLSGESLHGPVVLRRDSAHSIIVLKISANPPFGSRMPLGCTGQVCVNDADALLISDWIDQGTRDN